MAKTFKSIIERLASFLRLPRVCHRFGISYHKQQRYDEAVKWFRISAERGYAKAQVRMGDAYWWRFGVEEDKNEAVKWYRKAAEQGNIKAQVNMGYAYHHGWGVMPDYRETLRYWRKLADEGRAVGQYLLGWMFYKAQIGAPAYEEGVTSSEAHMMLKKAADQGYLEAKRLIEDVYYGEF